MSLRAVGLFAVVLFTSVAFAQDDDVENALTRLPQRAPGPAFPEFAEIDMETLCGPERDQIRQRYYPERALRQGVTGRVVLDCALGPDGRADICQVLYESPTGFGFGDSASRIACHFVVNVEELGEGVPTGNLPRNARVYRRHAEGEPWRERIPIRFQVR